MTFRNIDFVYRFCKIWRTVTYSESKNCRKPVLCGATAFHTHLHSLRLSQNVDTHTHTHSILKSNYIWGCVCLHLEVSCVLCTLMTGQDTRWRYSRRVATFLIRDGGHWDSLKIALNKTLEVLFFLKNNIAVRVRT